ncbi:hypothetical protein KFK09_007544 [Dendrobium nobile]|uniref:Uncharacterized protein n=1 Tax=Dendrobium nobile TaxID=94219 RepID=A0A8T3BUP0_DENNO|nr:hypothetical protein KFK09_007544 [Dendrobium nobile]
MSTIGSCAANVQHPSRTSSEMPRTSSEMPLLTEDGDSSLVPLLGSMSSSHAARPLGIKNTRCVVSSAAFFVGLYVLQLPVDGVFDTNPQGLVIPVGRKLLQGLSLFMFIFALVGNSTYVGSILVNSLEWSKIKPNLPWLVDAGGCVLLDAFILIQFIYFNYRNAARKAADIESGCRSMNGAQHL